MDLNSTPLIKYHEIRVDDTDIYDDAFGFNSGFNDVLSFLGKADIGPSDGVTERLIELISSTGR